MPTALSGATLACALLAATALPRALSLTIASARTLPLTLALAGTLSLTFTLPLSLAIAFGLFALARLVALTGLGNFLPSFAKLVGGGVGLAGSGVALGALLEGACGLLQRLLCGGDIHRIQRFADPVLLERARAAELATAAHPMLDDGPSVLTLLETVQGEFEQPEP